MPRIETIRYVRSNYSLRPITPVLRKWCELVEYYSEVTGDASYWYNERATLSTVASAAWQQGWVALEEYSTRKFRGFDPENQEKPAHGSGRCDIYLCSPHGQGGYACEAKQAWLPIGNQQIKDPLKVVRKNRLLAWEDTGRLTKFEAKYRLAITICVPMIAFRQQQGKLDADRATEQILAWCEMLETLKDVHSMAYVFPRHTRMLSNDKKLRVFPGVALLVSQRIRQSTG